MVAMARFTLLYFTKFLSRADRHHLDQSFSVAVPLLFYVGTAASRSARRRFAALARGAWPRPGSRDATR